MSDLVAGLVISTHLDQQQAAFIKCKNQQMATNILLFFILCAAVLFTIRL